MYNARMIGAMEKNAQKRDSQDSIEWIFGHILCCRYKHNDTDTSSIYCRTIIV